MDNVEYTLVVILVVLCVVAGFLAGQDYTEWKQNAATTLTPQGE